MNIREDIRQLKTGERELRKFGLVVGGVFALLGALLFLRHKVHYVYFLWPGLALFGIGLLAPRTLKWIYIAWMSLAFVLGFVVAHVILTLFFVLVVTPVGLCARMVGRDFLSLKLDRAAKSYWLLREKKVRKPEDYERQF